LWLARWATWAWAVDESMLSAVLQSNLLRWEQMVRYQQKKNTHAVQIEECAAVDEQKESETSSGALNGLLAENKSLKDKNVELQNEMNALRQRSDRDKDEFKKYAISEFAADIVCVADNIRRAIEAVPKEQFGATPGLKSLIEGFEVTERSLLSTLNRHKVTRFDPLGEPFNPYLHEAKSMVSASGLPTNTVAQVVHAGYMIGERLLRPAAVVVTQAGAVIDQTCETAAATHQACSKTVSILSTATAAQHAGNLAFQAVSDGAGPAPYALPADLYGRSSSLLHKPVMPAPADEIPVTAHPNCVTLDGKPYGAPEYKSADVSRREETTFQDDEAAYEAAGAAFASDPAKAVRAVNEAFEKRNYAEAARLQESIAEAVRRAEIDAEGNPGAGALGALLNLSWYQLFTGHYDAAIATADRAAAICEGYISIDTNRAHALMLRGFTDEAWAIYNRHRGKETQNKKTWEREVLDDFAEMEQAEIKHPLMDEIRSAWTVQS
jgi:molecular chaperone GrpE